MPTIAGFLGLTGYVATVPVLTTLMRAELGPVKELREFFL
jgi:hypothetical protein